MSGGKFPEYFVIPGGLAVHRGATVTPKAAVGYFYKEYIKGQTNHGMPSITQMWQQLKNDKKPKQLEGSPHLRSSE